MFHGRKRSCCSGDKCFFSNEIILRKSYEDRSYYPTEPRSTLAWLFFSSAWTPAWLAAHRYRGAIGYVYFFLIFAGDGVGEGRRDRNRFRGRGASWGSRRYHRIYYQLIHASTTLPHLSHRRFSVWYRDNNGYMITSERTTYPFPVDLAICPLWEFEMFRENEFFPVA